MMKTKIIDAIKKELNKESQLYGEKILLELKVDIGDVRFIEVECTPYGECEDTRELLSQEQLNYICITDSRYITNYTSVDIHSVDLYDKNGDYINSLNINEIKF